MGEFRGEHEHVARELASWLVREEGDLERVVLLVRLFPDGAIHDLQNLAEFVGGDAGARLHAAILLRQDGEAPPLLVGRALDSARRASHATRAAIYTRLAPAMQTDVVEGFITELSGTPAGEPQHVALKRLTELRDLRLDPIAPPGALPAAGHWPPLVEAETSDARLVGIAERLDQVDRDALLRAVYDLARSEAGGATAAAAPPPASAEAEPSRAPEPEPEPKAAPVPDAAVLDDAVLDDAVLDAPLPPASEMPPPAPRIPPPTLPSRQPSVAAPPPMSAPPAFRIGNPLSALGDAIRNAAGAVRDAVLGGRTVSSRFPRAEPPSGMAGDILDEPVTKRPVVNTGLAASDAPATALDPYLPLQAGRAHLFWLEIGEAVAKSIEVTAMGIAPALAKAEAEVDVVLFDATRALVVVKGASRGRLRLRPDGSAIVLAQPTTDPPKGVSNDLAGRRLFFPIQTPETDALLNLRCNIYHDGTLIQSRLVRCLVRSKPAPTEGALRSTLDYVLSRSLNPKALAAAGPHSLSIMTNESGGTHGFYFAGDKTKWARAAQFDGHELQGLLDSARGALRMAAWGSSQAWNHDLPYLYDGSPDINRLTDDVIRLAIRGFAFYSAIVDRLAASGDDADAVERFAALMRPPGTVQVAVHAKPRFLLPASLVYDYDLDTGLDLSEYTLCEQFQKDLSAASAIEEPLARATRLEDGPCFKGQCPNATGSFSVACPSGLWGFRHSIGLPVSLESDEEWAKHARKPWEPGEDEDPPSSIEVKDALAMTASISTDPNLKLWKTHEPNLQALRGGLAWQLATTREATFEQFTRAPHLLYFYCHGGVDISGRPFLSVGPVDGQGIFGDNLRARKVRWSAPRPLVFINGCHTTDLEPEVAHELVSAFVAIARASGVIGTEITIFEPLAREFAETFFKAFVAGQSVGEAVRTARLALLARSNPLGLAYTAYALSSLKLAGLKN